MSKNRKIGKRLHRGLSILLTFALLFGMTAGFSGPALAAESVLTPSNNGTVTAVNGGNYVISASGTYTGWRFIVPNGVTATLTVSGTLTLNNQNGGGSPIDVQAGGALNLVVNGTLTVYGQIAGGLSNNAATGGTPGYAGIQVPRNATISISGTGTLYAYGGDGGDGSNGWSNLSGAAGAGGAGAGIGGSGGSGANLSSQGLNGESAGAITFNAGIRVFAYGGGGGKGGDTGVNGNSGDGDGSGGGGYPAAGVGGGGAGAGGGDGGDGGGGFSGGAGSWFGMGGTNGLGGVSNKEAYQPAAGYFQIGYYNGIATGTIGGGSRRNYNGGVAGAGGMIKIYTNQANIKSYNGSCITTSTSGASGNSWGQNPTPIYAQLGYSLDNIRAKGISAVTARTDAAMAAELASKGVAKTIATTGISGIGSGAGYTETSNGTVQYGTQLDLGTLTADLHLTPSTNNGVPYILFGIQDTYNVVVESGNVVLILDSATINMSNQTGKSAIDVKPGASLALEVIGTSKLYGATAGIGKDGISGAAPVNAAAGGVGGTAALAVPTGAAINISGTGILYAYGGDAASGGNANNALGNGIMRTGGGGGGGAGAGIGANGGAGGQSGNGYLDTGANAGSAGIAGAAAGNITVNAKVFAYGGSGGSGGDGGVSNKDNNNAAGGAAYNPAYGGGGGGGGGYPAAGIGGGGGGGGGGESDVNSGMSTHGGGGGGGFSGGGGGGYSYTTSDGKKAAGATNGGGGSALVGYATGPGGGGYFAAGQSSVDPQITSIGGAIYGGGGGYNMSTTRIGGDGGAGGGSGTITIVDKSLVFAQNGSKITTSTSASQSWAAANATPIRTQASQGYGAGAGYTETDGKVVFMGAPDAPTSVSATLSGTYGDSATVSWNVPAGTGGDGVALTGYTVKSVGFGINRTLAPADYTVAGNRVTVTLTGLPHNTKGTFTVYALNAKGASVESVPSNELTTKGVPLAPKNVEAHMIDGTVDKAAALWNGPDISYNNIKMTGDADYGKYRGKARQKQAHFSHRQG